MVETLFTTLTPTPYLVVVYDRLPGMCSKLYQEPDGPVIGYYYLGKTLTVLYGREIVGGLVWIEVMDDEGGIGWIPEACTQLITLTPSMTPTFTPTEVTP